MLVTEPAELRYAGEKNSVGILSLGKTCVDVKVSSGVEPFNENHKEDIAWVARGPWRELSTTEKSNLFIKSPSRWPDQLVVVDLSSDRSISHSILLSSHLQSRAERTMIR